MAKRPYSVYEEHLSRLVMAPVNADSLEAPGEPPSSVPETQSTRGELSAAREGAAAAGTTARMAALSMLPSLNARVGLTQYRPAEGGAFEPRWLVALSRRPTL